VLAEAEGVPVIELLGDGVPVMVVGVNVGCLLGRSVGDSFDCAPVVGAVVGSLLVGAVDVSLMSLVGVSLGRGVGCVVGQTLGRRVGHTLGCFVGHTLGGDIGDLLGIDVGIWVATDGTGDGTRVGELVRCSVGAVEGLGVAAWTGGREFTHIHTVKCSIADTTALGHSLFIKRS
jgi:hypothetical protein